MTCKRNEIPKCAYKNLTIIIIIENIPDGSTLISLLSKSL